MLDFNIKVEDSLKLLKHEKNYPTYAKDKKVFALPAISIEKDGLKVGDNSFSMTIPNAEVSIDYHRGIRKRIDIIRCLGRIMYFTLKLDGDKYVPSRYEVQSDVLKSLEETPLGTVLDGRIWSHGDNGDYVDLGNGVLALLPLEYMTADFTERHDTRYAIDQKIKCVLHSTSNGKLKVNTVPLYGTFEENAANFKEHNAYIGIVRSSIPSGTFISLAPNFIGLTKKPTPDLKKGDYVSVYIKEIDTERARVVVAPMNKSEAPAPTFGYIGDVQNMKRITKWTYSPNGPKNKNFVYEEDKSDD